MRRDLSRGEPLAEEGIQDWASDQHRKTGCWGVGAGLEKGVRGLADTKLVYIQKDKQQQSRRRELHSASWDKPDGKEDFKEVQLNSFAVQQKLT